MASCHAIYPHTLPSLLLLHPTGNLDFDEFAAALNSTVPNIISISFDPEGTENHVRASSHLTPPETPPHRGS